MKKQAFLILLLALLSLNGCQSQSNTISAEIIKKNLANQESYTGLMQSLGGAFNSSGATHLLRKDDGKTIFLKSNTIDLGADKYLGKQVEVMGEMKKSDKGSEFMLVTSIDQVEATVDKIADLPEWIDYHSDNLALNLKYRNDYKLTESGELITIEKQLATEDNSSKIATEKANDDKQSIVSLKLLSNDPDFDLFAEMGVENDTATNLQSAGYVKSKITQKGLDSYKKSSNSGKNVSYYLKNTNSYLISFEANNEDSFTEDQNMFYDILASIDFGGDAMVNPLSQTEKTELMIDDEVKQNIEKVNQSESENQLGFEKFSSESQKFSLQYPKSYYFGSVTANDSNVSKSYQFGIDPLEEKPGEIQLDILKNGDIAGKSESFNSKNIFVEKANGSVKVYVDMDGRIFRITAPASKEALAKNMATTIISN